MARWRSRWGIWVAALSAGALAGAPGWQVERSEPDGLVLEARTTADSSFPELRVRTTSPVVPAVLLARVWARHRDSVEGRLTERSEVLYESPSERLVYVRLRLPAVSPRDYTMRYRRQLDPATGIARLDFEVDEAAGPAPSPGVVRMRLARGGWTFEPAPGGGSAVTYRVLSDPAGDVPVWLASGEQRSIALAMVREALAPHRLRRP